MSRLFLAPTYHSGLFSPHPQYNTPLPTLPSSHSYASSSPDSHCIHLDCLLTLPRVTVQKATLPTLFRGCLSPQYQLFCVCSPSGQ